MVGKNNKGEPKRAPNFSRDEIEVLKREFETRKNILLPKFSNSITREVKDAAWDEITSAVNKISPTVRTRDSIEKKWDNVKSTYKKEMADKMTYKELHATGGGPPKDCFTEDEERMMGMIGKAAVLGIDDGIDTSVGATLCSAENLDNHPKIEHRTLVGNKCNLKEPKPSKNTSNLCESNFLSNEEDKLKQLSEEHGEDSLEYAKAVIGSRPKRKHSTNEELLEIQRGIYNTLQEMLKVITTNSKINEEKLKVEQEMLNIKRKKYNT